MSVYSSLTVPASNPSSEWVGSKVDESGLSLSLAQKKEAAEIENALSVRIDVAPHDSSEDFDIRDRDTWTGNMDFVFSCIGYAVGLGNIWRFPYLCYMHGGGAFLVPYLLFATTVAMPLFLMEISFGQFASLSPITIWRICPLFKGLGYGMVIVCFEVCSYYNVILAWNFYYMFNCFSTTLPWTLCGQEWNTPNCTEGDGPNSEFCIGPNCTTAAEEYYDRMMLSRSSGVAEMGDMRWELLGYLALAWAVVFLCLFKGIHATGKIVYATALFPYVVLIALLIRGLTLDGAMDGIVYYISPDFHKLLQPHVWSAAASQIFYSMGAAWGVLITMSSYNKFNNNVLSDTAIVPAVNYATSVFAGFCVFSILGFMAKQSGKKVEDVVASGFGLAFIAYPEAAGKMPAGNVWALAFFVMIFTLGLDSQFSMFETMTSAFIDEYPRFRDRKGLITISMILLEFAVGALYVTEGGIYLVNLVDTYSGTFSVMVISILEGIVISWIYGVDRFCKDIELMIGRRPPIAFKYMWKYFTPTITLAIYVLGMTLLESISYHGVPYPIWGIVLGFLIGFVSLIPIPVMMVVSILQEEGPIIVRIKKLLLPTISYGPVLPDNYKRYVATLTNNELKRSSQKYSRRVSTMTDVEKRCLSIRRHSTCSTARNSQRNSLALQGETALV